MVRKSIFKLLSLMSLVGCQNNVESGVYTGIGVGAVGGALMTGTLPGAFIGAGVGAVSGALIGSILDDSDRQSLDRESSSTLRKIDRKEQLSTLDIKKMVKAGLSNDVIISQINTTHSVFYLNSADIIDLKKAGVSQKVIDYMIETANR